MKKILNKNTHFKDPQVILVTGCAGFIGSNFVHTFKQQFPKTRIIGIDDFSAGRRDALDPVVTLYEGSITDETLVERVFKKHKPEYVFHFAAIPRVSFSVEQPIITSEVNIIGTITLLTYAQKYNTKRFIFSSSSSVYGGAKKLPTKESENEPNPQSPYAAQKLAGEIFCTLSSTLYGLDTVSLRYFNVFGPGQYGDSAYATVICAWLESLYFPTKKKPFVEGNGTQSRDFCYVDNIVHANICAMRAPDKLNGSVFNIANGTRTSLIQVHARIEKLTGKKLSLEKRAPRLGDVRHTHADIAKAKKYLGYTPLVDFTEGVARTIAWFETRKK